MTPNPRNNPVKPSPRKDKARSTLASKFSFQFLSEYAIRTFTSSSVTAINKIGAEDEKSVKEKSLNMRCRYRGYKNGGSDIQS